MKSIKKALIGIIGVAAMVLQMAAPAGAMVEAGAVVYVGTATTAQIGYVGVYPPASNTTYSFNSSIACVGGGVAVDKAPKPIAAVYPNTCSIAAGGTFVSANCGRSTGNVTGTVTTPNNVYRFTGSIQTAGGTVIVTGTVTKPSDPTFSGTVVSVAQAIPNPTAGSCAMNTQTGFIVVGVAAYVGTN